MKWIGSHIWDFISRFRNDVYLEDISTGTIASGGNLGLDSHNKIVKDSGVGATDLHGAGVDGSANQLLTDDGDGTVTSESTLTYDSEVLTIGADDSGIATIARKTHGDNDGGHITIQSGNATGANKTGGDVIIDAGEGTGSGAGGRLIFKSHAAGSSGSSAGSTTERATIDSSGNLSIDGDITVKGNDIKDDDGTTCITFDSSGNTTVANTLNANVTGNLTGNASGTAATVTAGTQAAITTCANLVTTGTIGTGVWQGTAIASAYLDADTAHLSGAQTFTGKKTINIRAFEITDASTHGDAIGDIVYTGTGTLTAGKIYYLRTNNAWTETDADAAASSTGLLGVACADGAASTVGVLLRGTITLSEEIGGTEAIGNILYLDTTAATATVTAPSASGDIVRVIGYSLSTDNDMIWFNPDNSWVEIA
jgi:hypothetical protein